jgi:hypothetical protein
MRFVATELWTQAKIKMGLIKTYECVMFSGKRKKGGNDNKK